MRDSKASLKLLQTDPKLVTTTSTDDIVSIFKIIPQMEGIRIGALTSLIGFYRTAHVLYFVKEREENSLDEPVGDSICMIISESGSIYLELSKSLNSFWGYWELQQNFDFSKLSEMIDDMVYFFERREPKDAGRYLLRDGASNNKFHRYDRSRQKTNQLKDALGYNILASES